MSEAPLSNSNSLRDSTFFTANRTFTVFVTGCAGDRNVISHGYATR
jgi:hypothetical protein